MSALSDSSTPEQQALLYGSRFLTEDAPAKDFPASGMPALDVMRLVDEETLGRSRSTAWPTTSPKPARRWRRRAAPTPASGTR